MRLGSSSQEKRENSGSYPVVRDNHRPVLVIGAYGLAGKVIVESVLDAGLPVIAAGRNRDKLKEQFDSLRKSFPQSRLISEPVDINDGSRLSSLINESSLVINCVGPYIQHGIAVARKSVAAGVPYIDLASEQTHYLRIQELSAEAKKHDVLLGTGYGLYPGISGIMATELLSRLQDPEAVDICLAMGRNPNGEGEAQTLSGILELTEPLRQLEGGHLNQVRPGTKRIVSYAEPFGKRNAMNWPQMELLDFAGDGILREATSAIYVLGQRPLSGLEIGLLRLLQPERHPRLLRWLGKMASISSRTKRDGSESSGAVVTVRAKSQMAEITESIRAPDTEAATAIIPTIVAERLLKGGGRRGTLPSGITMPRHWIALRDLKHRPEIVERKHNSGESS